MKKTKVHLSIVVEVKAQNQVFPFFWSLLRLHRRWYTRNIYHKERSHGKIESLRQQRGQSYSFITTPPLKNQLGPMNIMLIHFKGSIYNDLTTFNTFHFLKVPSPPNTDPLRTKFLMHENFGKNYTHLIATKRTAWYYSSLLLLSILSEYCTPYY